MAPWGRLRRALQRLTWATPRQSRRQLSSRQRSRSAQEQRRWLTRRMQETQAAKLERKLLLAWVAGSGRTLLKTGMTRR